MDFGFWGKLFRPCCSTEGLVFNGESYCQGKQALRHQEAVNSPSSKGHFPGDASKFKYNALHTQNVYYHSAYLCVNEQQHVSFRTCCSACITSNGCIFRISGEI